MLELLAAGHLLGAEFDDTDAGTGARAGATGAVSPGNTKVQLRYPRAAQSMTIMGVPLASV